MEGQVTHINIRIDGGSFGNLDDDASRFLENDSGQTHRLLDAIEQQKLAVEQEIARLREAAGMANFNEWRDQPNEGIRYIQRQNPRLVISRESNEEHRLAKKTRANWTLPTLQKSMQSSNGGFLQNGPDDDTVQIELKVEQPKKLRMVTHFGKQSKLTGAARPPLPSSLQSGVTRNIGLSTQISRSKLGGNELSSKLTVH